MSNNEEDERIRRIAEHFRVYARSNKGNLPVILLTPEVARMPIFERLFTSKEIQEHLDMPVFCLHRSRPSNEHEEEE